MASNEISGAISEERIAACVRAVTLKTKGVYSFSPALAQNLLNKDSVFKGIKITDDGNGITVDVYVKVNYGVKIPEIAWDLQENIKSKIETALHINVNASNIHIQGVHRSKEE